MVYCQKMYSYQSCLVQLRKPGMHVFPKCAVGDILTHQDANKRFTVWTYCHWANLDSYNHFRASGTTTSSSKDTWILLHSLVCRVLRLQHKFHVLQATNVAEDWQWDYNLVTYWIMKLAMLHKYRLAFPRGFSCYDKTCSVTNSTRF